MPNPAIHTGPHDPAEQREPSANGILAWVHGPDVSRGIQSLPKAQAGEQSPRTVVIEAEHVGLVRMTYALNSYKHRRSRFWHWRSEHAEKVEAPADTTPSGAARY